MEVQATARARRAESLRQGLSAADRQEPPQPGPSYSPSPPPGLTSWGRLQEARPPLGRPSGPAGPLHPAGTEPPELKTGGTPRKAERGS